MTLFTPAYGKLKVIAKGVRRTTSRLGGALEPAGRVARGAGPRPYLRRGHAGPGQSRLAAPARQSRVGGHRPGISPSSRTARWRSGTRPRLCTRCCAAPTSCSTRAWTPAESPRWYEMHLADELGVRPELDRCVECDRTLEADERFRWVPPLGGVLCPAVQVRPRVDRPLDRRPQGSQGVPAHGRRSPGRAPAAARRGEGGGAGSARLPQRLARAPGPLPGLPRRDPAPVDSGS